MALLKLPSIEDVQLSAVSQTSVGEVGHCLPRKKRASGNVALKHCKVEFI